MCKIRIIRHNGKCPIVFPVNGVTLFLSLRRPARRKMGIKRHSREKRTRVRDYIRTRKVYTE